MCDRITQNERINSDIMLLIFNLICWNNWQSI